MLGQKQTEQSLSILVHALTTALIGPELKETSCSAQAVKIESNVGNQDWFKVEAL